MVNAESLPLMIVHLDLCACWRK